MKAKKSKRYDLAVVGGAGHVGFPLSLMFAHRGLDVLIYDKNEKAMRQIQAGEMPFMEYGAEPILKEVLKSGRISYTASPEQIANADSVIITIGTPVDRFMNPCLQDIQSCLDSLRPYLSSRQLLVLRSTVYPGMTQWLDKYLRSKGKRLKISFCPERIVQGYAIKELSTIPQIVSGIDAASTKAAAKLFKTLTPDIVSLKPMEAEFAKLFSNAYRYINFAIANQFYMIAKSAGVDYYNVLKGLKKDYPRAKDVPGAGLAAGPCLLKDTMQLAAFFRNQFSLGHAAMLINEGFPQFIVDHLLPKYDLAGMTIGLLGMAFKADIDDTRDSLSYKLKRLLQFQSKAVLTSDPFVNTDPDLTSLEQTLKQSDLLILCVPHAAYKKIKTKKPVIDIWNFLPK